jgi:outer membrane protein TolC
LQAALERGKAGLGTELDVLQARSGRDQADYVLAAAEGRLEIARGALAYAIGFPADTVLPIAVPAQDTPPPLPAADLRRLLDETLRRRPDLRALRSAVAASEASIDVVGASLWPSLYLNGNLAHSTYDTYGGKDFQDDDTSYGAGVSLQWTLFDGAQTINARRIARAQTDALRAQLEQAESAAALEAWSRYHAYTTALKKSAAASGFLDSSTAAYQLALDSYQAGLVSILDVLNAESQVAQARGQFVLARHEALTALTDLAYATGQLGLESNPSQSSITPSPAH